MSLMPTSIVALSLSRSRCAWISATLHGFILASTGVFPMGLTPSGVRATAPVPPPARPLENIAVKSGCFGGGTIRIVSSGSLPRAGILGYDTGETPFTLVGLRGDLRAGDSTTGDRSSNMVVLRFSVGLSVF